MKSENYEETLKLPDGVQASIEDRVISIKGPKGEVKKKLIEPSIKISVEGGKVIFRALVFAKDQKKMLGTYRAHINNMVKGVTQGHEYQLKVCSGHFPMNVEAKGSVFQVKNYLGEKVPRKLNIRDGAQVKVEGDFVNVSGIDKELVAQTAADIEQLTRRSRFDKRIFQDGIYIVNKDGKEIK
jgi:large subunit ribosomal protein L6